MNADFLSDREQIGGVNEKFEAVDGNFHLVVDAFEDQVRHTSMDCAFLRFYEVDILRTDYNIDRLVFAESDIDALEFRAENLDEAVLNHNTVKNVAVADEVCNECVLRLIVNILRCTDLLDISLDHDNDRVGHRKGFFLIVGNIDESDAKLVFQADQLVLHILSEL